MSSRMRAEEPAAAEPVVEVVPVEGADRGRIVPVLAARGKEVQPAAVRERPFQGDGMPLNLGILEVPVVLARRRVQRGRLRSR